MTTSLERLKRLKHDRSDEATKDHVDDVMDELLLVAPSLQRLPIMTHFFRECVEAGEDNLDLAVKAATIEMAMMKRTERLRRR